MTTPSRSTYVSRCWLVAVLPLVGCGPTVEVDAQDLSAIEGRVPRTCGDGVCTGRETVKNCEIERPDRRWITNRSSRLYPSMKRTHSKRPLALTPVTIKPLTVPALEHAQGALSLAAPTERSRYCTMTC